MSDPAIQVATLVNDADAKLAGMYEVFNGGTTSLGAQLQRLQHLAEVNDPFRDRFKNPEARRLMSIHAIGVSGDFPALAALLPSKGSTSAHRYDRKSTLDQRSDRYGKPFSLLQPTGVGAFRRLESNDILDAVSRAAKEKRVTYRHDILSNAQPERVTRVLRMRYADAPMRACYACVTRACVTRACVTRA